MSKQFIYPNGGSPFGMSQAIVDKESKLVHISGQVDWDEQGQVTKSTVAEQFKVALNKLTNVLDSSSSSVEEILQMRIYVRGEVGEYLPEMSPVLADYLGTSRPSITGIGVSSLVTPEVLVEVEAVARVN